MSSKYLSTATGTLSWATATNWSDLVVPVNSDTVTLQGAGALASYLNQAAVTLAALNVPMSFTGSAGLAAQAPVAITSINRASSTATVVTTSSHGYATGDTVVVSGAVETEYNGKFTITVTNATTYTYTVSGTPATPASTATALVSRLYDKLLIGATAVRIGDPGNGTAPSTGSGRFNLDLSSIQSAVTIINTKQQSATDTGLEPVRIIGTHASNALTQIGGFAGIATTVPTEVATFLTINQNGGRLNCGPGLTWTQINQNAGTLNLNGGSASTVSYIAQGGGLLSLAGAGVVANATFAGQVNFAMRKASAGDTVTGTLQLESGAILDLSGNPANLSVATLKISGSDIVIRRNKANPGHFSWSALTQEPGSSFRLE